MITPEVTKEAKVFYIFGIVLNNIGILQIGEVVNGNVFSTIGIFLLLLAYATIIYSYM
jgi:hypothetical protein